MALITLSASSGFTLIPEGTHIFKVTGVTYKKLYGKMEVYLETKEGLAEAHRAVLPDGQERSGQSGCPERFQLLRQVRPEQLRRDGH